MKRLLPSIPLAATLLACHGMALAATWPDSVAPCNTSLQACIDAQAAGATVEISVLAPEVVGATLQLTRAITLKSGPSARGQLRDSTIFITANAVGTATTRMENLRLVDSTINVSMGSNEPLDQHIVDLDQLEIVNPTAGSGIQFTALSPASVKRLNISHLNFIGTSIGINAAGATNAVELLVRNSYFKLTGPNSSAANLLSLGSGAQVRWERNRVETLAALSNQICLQIQTNGVISGSAVVVATIRRNEFLGCSESIRLDPRLIDINATVQNNSFQRANRHITNIGVGPATTTLRLSNNVFANSVSTMPFNPGALTILNNLYFNSPVPAAVETGRVETNPLFLRADDLRLQSVSPARDVGAGAEVPLLDSDFDGQRAVIGTAPDIGAHEWSDALSIEHTATATNTSGNVTSLPLSAFVSTLDLPQAMSVWNGPVPVPVWAPNHIGIYSQSDFSFKLFNQNTAATLSLGQTFFAMRNGQRDTSIEHIANAASSTAFPNVTRLDHPRLNGQTAVLPVVTQRWNPFGMGGVYNDHPVGLWYFSGRWHVYNQSSAAMPDGAGFHVLVPELFNDYAFRVDVPTLRGGQILDHPRLNNNRCAHFVVSAVYGNPLSPAAPGVNTPSNLLVRFNAAPNEGGYWIVYRGDGGNIPAGAAFNVYVEPVRSRQCVQERIFADAFE